MVILGGEAEVITDNSVGYSKNTLSIHLYTHTYTHAERTGTPALNSKVHNVQYGSAKPC